jgi:hypothetical protein
LGRGTEEEARLSSLLFAKNREFRHMVGAKFKGWCFFASFGRLPKKGFFWKQKIFEKG